MLLSERSTGLRVIITRSIQIRMVPQMGIHRKITGIQKTDSRHTAPRIPGAMLRSPTHGMGRQGSTVPVRTDRFTVHSLFTNRRRKDAKVYRLV